VRSLHGTRSGRAVTDPGVNIATAVAAVYASDRQTMSLSALLCCTRCARSLASARMRCPDRYITNLFFPSTARMLARGPKNSQPGLTTQKV